MTVPNANQTPGRLAIWLTIYFALLFGATLILVSSYPGALKHLPLGGTDALHAQEITSIEDFLSGPASRQDESGQVVFSAEDQSRRIAQLLLFALAHLGGTVLVMLPITWTYKAVKFESGFNKSFLRTLIILPICATTIVLLIQDSLALAFGLAALVAAVRFRVALDEAMDGIFIFAAICVGLAAGIGYLGIAALMAVFFCFTNLVLWAVDYGRNPIDDARREKRRRKIAENQPTAE